MSTVPERGNEKMTSKLPIGIQGFKGLRNDGYVYVDKTEYIYDLVHNGKVYFLSRPRRFGKSLLLSTMKNYWEGKKELFSGLEIEKLEKDWIEYPVIKISFGVNSYENHEKLKARLKSIITELEEYYKMVMPN